MYIYMGHMRFEDTKPYEDWFWQKNGIELLRAHVAKIDTAAKTLFFTDDGAITYDKLVIATGSESNKFGWPGQDLPGVQGLYSYQDLELLEKNTAGIDNAVIVGGGLIGIEMAEMLQSRDIDVTFLVREKHYWDNILPEEEAKLVSKHVLSHGIKLHLNTNLKAILPGDDGRVRAVVTEHDEELPCQFVALTPGVHPNIDVAKDSAIETARGVLVNEYLETNVPDVFAAGDCAEIKAADGSRNRIEQLWYTGKLQGQALAQTICGERTRYDRGIWFNSAKFLDLEYQTYGFVSNVPLDHENAFYWEHPDETKSLRIVYDAQTEAVTGFNFFGMRASQQVCENWLRGKQTIDRVLPNLSAANFDPEFYTTYEEQIISAYNQQNPDKNLLVKPSQSRLHRLFAKV
jgi:NADPH-dependent 2,4-dienoyl-CoA reductase/sulfur reductase-like enzyme